MSKCFGMNCDHVLRWNVKSYKICAFKNKINKYIYNDWHKTCDILGQL
jgi:hypothetical protein